MKIKRHYANIYECRIDEIRFIIANNMVYAQSESGSEIAVKQDVVDLLKLSLQDSKDKHAKWCLDKVKRFGGRLLTGGR